MNRPSKLELDFSESELTASICRDDFYEFVQEFWDTIITQEPVWNWHIKYLCEELQRVAERVFKGEKCKHDLVINIPPGTSKSTICSVMFPAWVWTRMPHAQFICGSHTQAVALDLARRCKGIINSDKYKACFPDMVLTSEATIQMVNSANGFRLSVGTGGVTGFHAHFILVDDPIDPQAAGAVSGLEREKALKWMGETLSTRKIDKEVTVTILIMQRLHQADPAALMTGQIEGMDWGNPVRHICLPWKLSDKVAPTKLRAFYSSEGLLDPIRLSNRIGEGFRAKLGSFGFSCQFEQHPVPLEGGMFKTAMLRIEQPPVRFKRVVRYWDKAGTQGGGCYTAGVKMAEDFEGRFWVLDVVRGQWESHNREAMIRRTAQLDTKRIKIGLEIEGGSGGKESGENTIRKTLAGFSVFAEHPTGDKAVRADPFSVQVNAGNVLLATGGGWQAAYIEELKYFPASTFADQVDASSGAFNMLTSRITVGAPYAASNEEISQRLNKPY